MHKFLILTLAVTFVSANFGNEIPNLNNNLNVDVLNTNVKNNNVLNNILTGFLPLKRSFHYRTLNGYVPNYNNYGYTAGSYRGIIPNIGGVKDTVESIIPMKRSFNYRNLPNQYNNYQGPYKRGLVDQLLTTLPLPFKRSIAKSRTFSKNYNSYGY